MFQRSGAGVRSKSSFGRGAARLIVAAGVCVFAASFEPSAAHASGVDPTKISLPGGPASIEGLGQELPRRRSRRAPPPTESTSRSPPAAGGFAPHLSLDYDGGGGVSELGIGWRSSADCSACDGASMRGCPALTPRMPSN